MPRPESGEKWFQDHVGWGGRAYCLAGEQRWLDDERSVQDYPDLDGEHVWTVLATSESRPICGATHPEKDDGVCVMPPAHLESPHVWGSGIACFILSLSVKRGASGVNA